MKNFIILISIFLSVFSLNAQNTDDYVHDPEARKRLDKLSESLEKHKTARFYFLYTVYNAQDSSKHEYYGYLFVKDSVKYKVIIPDVEVFSDGEKLYTFNKKNNEMNITFLDPENEQIYTPQKMINMYKKGFKYSYRGELTFDAKVKKNGKVTTESKTCDVVDLYPAKPKTTPYSIIRIWIDKNKNELVSVKYQYKSGIEEVVEILSTDYDVKINDDIFKFDKSKYPSDMDIIDFTSDN